MIRTALKDLKLFFKDRRSVLLTFAIPIALITLFAFAFGGVGKSADDSKITLLISDLDQTELSQQAIGLFDSLASLHIKSLPLDEAEGVVKKGNASCVLIIHHGFADSLKASLGLPLELKYDQAREIEVGLIQQSLIPTIAEMPFSLGDPREMMKNRLSKIAGSSNRRIRDSIRTQSDILFDVIAEGINENDGRGNESSRVFMGADIKMTKLVEARKDNQLGLIQAVAGTAVMMLLFSVVGIDMGLIEEKQEGTLKRLLYTPVKPLSILLGKMLSANVISIIQLVVMFIFAALVFGLDVGSHIGGLAIAIVATAFACSAFGVLLASFAKSKQQVQGLSTLIILIMSAIGGSMIPLFFMPAFMQKLAVISVNYWSIQGFYDVLWREMSILDLTFLSRIGMLVFIGIVLNAAAVVMFKKNILKLS